MAARDQHDGFRVIARKAGKRVKLFSRPGNDLTNRFPLITETLARLKVGSCVIDGEAVACGNDGIASFDLLRHHRHDDHVFMWAFDLIELDGDDLRRDPLETRKATLAMLLARATAGIRFNEHLEDDDGPTVFRHACELGLEGIVSKRRRLALPLRALARLIKAKDPRSAAVRRRRKRMGSLMQPHGQGQSRWLLVAAGLLWLLAQYGSL